MMTAELWYADGDSAGYDGTPTTYQKVRELGVERRNSHEALDQLWVWFNRGSGQEHELLEGIRSLSVGDRVVFRDDNDNIHETWQCASVGWDRVFDGESQNDPT